MKFYNSLITFLFVTVAFSYNRKLEIREDDVDWAFYDKCLDDMNTLNTKNVDVKCEDVIDQVSSLESKCYDSIKKDCPIETFDLLDTICTVYKKENCEKIEREGIENIQECKILSTKSLNRIKSSWYNDIYLKQKYFCNKNEYNQYCPIISDFKVSLNNPDTFLQRMGQSIANDSYSEICQSKICTEALVEYMNSFKEFQTKNKLDSPVEVDGLISYLQSNECKDLQKGDNQGQTNIDSIIKDIDKNQTSNATIVKRSAKLLIGLLLLTILF